MRRQNQFDEVMIVNPSEPGNQRVRTMRFHNIYTSDMAGYAEPDMYGYYAETDPYGYYAEADPYGYYAEDPLLAEDLMYGEVDPAYGYWGEVDPAYGYYGEVDPMMAYAQVDPMMGYYGETDPSYGYYSEADPMGYFAEEYPAVGYYGEEQPLGYYAEEQPLGYYAEEQPLGYYGYGETPEMVGYGEPDFAEDYPGVSYYGEPDYSGYLRDGNSAFNAGCPMPSNVSGYGDGFAGYSRPSTVNPSCDQITPQPGSSPLAPETFKPLW